MRILLALISLITIPAFAVTVPTYRDLKPSTQKMVEYQAFANLAASNSTTVEFNNAGPTAATAYVLSSFDAQPDVPRVITITPGGSTGSVAACDLVVSGTDVLNNAIEETLSFANNQTSVETSLKAFKTVTSVSFPANCEDSGFAANWNIGVGESIGVKRCMDYAGHVFFSTLNGAKEGTAPTMTADASVVSLNTADFNGTMNGSNDFELLFFQNFRCVR